MCVASTAKRRRRQAKQNYNHLALLSPGNNSRPIYRHKRLLSVHDAVAAEKRKAAAEARRKSGSKKGK